MAQNHINNRAWQKPGFLVIGAAFLLSVGCQNQKASTIDNPSTLNAAVQAHFAGYNAVLEQGPSAKPQELDGESASRAERIYKALHDNGLAYAKATTESTVVKDSVLEQGQGWVLHASNHATFTLNQNDAAGKAIVSSNMTTHELRLERKQNGYIVTNDRELQPQSQEIPAQEPSGTEPSPDLAPRFVGYNGIAAASYARAFALKYHPSYTNFNPVGGDCANFISQVIRAGGVGDTSSWNQYSFNWVNAEGLRQEVTNGLGMPANNIQELALGDLVFFGWNNSYSAGHVMVVTTITSNGNRLLSGHNYDRLDLPFTDIQAANPNTRYWYVRMTQPTYRVTMDVAAWDETPSEFTRLGLYPQYWWSEASDGGYARSTFTYTGNGNDQNFGEWSLTPKFSGKFDVFAFMPKPAEDKRPLGNYGEQKPADGATYKLFNPSGAEVARSAKVTQGRGYWQPIISNLSLSANTTYKLRLGDAVDGPANRKLYFDSVGFNEVASVGTGTGLRGEFWNNMNFSGSPAFRGVDAEVNVNWGTGAPKPNVLADNFSARWTGQLQAKFTGEWTFYMQGDDAVRLYINNQEVLTHWSVGGFGPEYTGKINLVAGQRYDIRVEMLEYQGIAGVQLQYSHRNQPKVAVETKQLYTAP